MASNNSNTPSSSLQLTCALSGEICIDPVVTPSGYICERRLLLSKLVDTAGHDPFDSHRTIDESELISLKADNNQAAYQYQPPPRPATAASFSSLLHLLQNEHDALLLELFDTRKALEETRMELSQALYQNDAAVRVIARLALERDEARQQVAQQLSNYSKPMPQTANVVVTEAEHDVMAIEPEDTETQDQQQQQTSISSSTNIPQAHVNNLVEAWKQLSDQRKQKKKEKTAANIPTPEQLATFADHVQTKSLHKSNKPGITSLKTILHPSTHHEYDLSAGVDKSVVIYNRTTQQIVQTLQGNAALTSIDAGVNTTQGAMVIVAGDVNGNIKVFHETSEGIFEQVGTEKLGLNIGSEKHQPIVNVSFHPMGHYILATIPSGPISVIKVDLEQNSIDLIASLQDPNSSSSDIRASGLHPDGLIYCIGKSDGSIQLWDLKTQSLASTLNSGSNGAAVLSLAFSENGYHFASSLASGEVIVWDLRKAKAIATLNKKENDDDDSDWVMEGPVHSIVFDPSAKYLAYAGIMGVRITVVKEWGRTAMFATKFKTQKKHYTTVIAWGAQSNCIVVGCSKDRSLMFFRVSEDEEEE